MRVLGPWVLLVALVLTGAGCNTILGNELHDLVPGGLADAAYDAAASAPDGAMAPTDASSTDAYADTSPAAESGDAEPTEPAPDAEPEAAEASPTCAPGGSCTFSECQLGSYVCDDGGPVCTATGQLEAGAACSGSVDAGALPDADANAITFVCNAAAACVECNAGGDCSDTTEPCIRKTYDCSTGVAECKEVGFASEGMKCGNGMYCYSGVCSPCTVNVACAPATNPCHAGLVTACTGGVATCTDQGTNAAAGLACQTATVPSGVCDGNGSCVVCSVNAQCTPAGTPCQSGTMTCSSGPRCVSSGNINQGKSCGTGEICSSGSCVPCNASTCPHGCCDTNGCVAAETTSECGLGGVACADCKPPGANGVAACNSATGSCGVTCNTGFHACGTTCADNTSVDTCGASCTACAVANASAACTSGACTVATCKAGFADCNTSAKDGCETNLMTSASNCGVCGHGCLAGGCVNGECQPFAIVSGTDGPVSITTDGAQVTWTNIDGTVQGVSVSGGTTRTLGDGTTTAGPFITNDGTYSYWPAQSSTGPPFDDVLLAPETGGAATVVYTNDEGQAGPNSTESVLAASGQLYFVFRNFVAQGGACGDTIRFQPIQMIGAGQGLPGFGGCAVTGLAADGTNIYWSDAGRVNINVAPAIRFQPLLGGATSTLASATNPVGIGTAGGFVYWTDATSNVLQRISTTVSMAPQTVAQTTAPGSLYVDGTNVYWIDKGGLVERVPVAGGLVTTVGAGQTAVAITGDSTSVYWANQGSPPSFTNGSIMRLRKK
jgi:hypothetical protein